MCVCCFVVAVILQAMQTIRFLDVLQCGFLPFTYTTVLLLLFLVRQLLAQMAMLRKRTYSLSVLSVNMTRKKKALKKKEHTR